MKRLEQTETHEQETETFTVWNRSSGKRGSVERRSSLDAAITLAKSCGARFVVSNPSGKIVWRRDNDLLQPEENVLTSQDDGRRIHGMAAEART